MEKRGTRLRPARKPRARKASTGDILSGSEPRGKIPRRWAPHYKRLLALREHLLRERSDRSEAAREESQSFSLHMADAGTDSYDRDLALGMLSSEQNAVYEIEQALDRIRRGTYGRCELTGKPIATQRLAAVPWTRFSAAAEKQLERDGVVQRTRIGDRERLPRADTQAQVGEEQS